jgi:2'-5' RNA ligase
MRLFVALALPDDIAASFASIQGGVPGARWQTRDQLHLTLRFIGEAGGREQSAIDDALSTIKAAPLRIEFKGTGEFGGKNPHTLWVGVRTNDALMHLQRKIETALQRVGLPPDPRKFTPHVTIARLRGTPRGRLMDYLHDHALYASPSFEAGAFILYSSLVTSDGSIYRAEKAYPLRPAGG